MRKKVCATQVVAALLGAAFVAAPGTAAAADCPSDSTTVYVAGSSAFAPVMQATAQVLGSAVKIVYQKPGSCQGLLDILGDTGSAVPKETFASALLSTDGVAGNNTTCTSPGGAGFKVDVGISDVYRDVCATTYDTALNAVGAGVKDFPGPVQAMTIAVPTESSQNAISAEAAYMVFGFGADSAAHTIAPWSVPGSIYVRFWDSGTLEMIGKAINLPGGKWLHATDKASPNTQNGSGPMAAAIHAAGGSAAIGILGAANLTADVKALAFQASNQSCSYYPDSSSTATDKLNVRQGRYAIWGAEHLLANVDGSGKPVGLNGNTAAVQTVINALTATSQAPAATSGGDAGAASTLTETQVGALIDAISVKTTGVVPQCAMQVSRSEEVGAEASYAPPAACSCRFEIAASGHPVTGHICTACTAATESTVCTGATPKCRFNYCEAE